MSSWCKFPIMGSPRGAGGSFDLGFLNLERMKIRNRGRAADIMIRKEAIVTFVCEAFVSIPYLFI